MGERLEGGEARVESAPNDSRGSVVLPVVAAVAGTDRVVDDERALVERARAGEAVAFMALVARYDRGLRALAYRLLGTRDRMDDALQDAYLKGFRSLASFEGRSAFGSWLYRIVYNACMDELRRERRGGFLQVPLDEAEPRPASAPDPGEVAAARVDLATALATLSPEMRTTVLLVDAEGMEYRDAAEVLGVPVGTVRSRLNRGRAVLREALDVDDVEGRKQS